MPLDFGLLSMTELRTRPGEILDRVADDGEAFIIERNGRQKALLVPLSAFLPDVQPARIADELEELIRNGEQPRATFTAQRELTLQFQLALSDGTPIEINVLLPHGYPNSCPRVLAASVRSDTPHRWADGALCLYGVMTGWNPGRHTVFSTLELVRQWLRRYETWCQSGRWPIEEGTAND